jgi:dihydropteroate synthase
MDGVHHYNPRFLVIRSPEEGARELQALGVGAAEARLLLADVRVQYLTLEGVDAYTDALVRDVAAAWGGKVVSTPGSPARETCDLLAAGSTAFFRALSTRLLQDADCSGRLLGKDLAESLVSSGRHEGLVISWRGRTIDFSSKTYIMGILNVTPDSFSDGGRFFAQECAVDQALRMAEEGADIIDIGGESSRPGAHPVAMEEELRRVVPVLQALVKQTEVVLSVDTMKAKVAEAALGEGAEMVNDISALRADPDMAPLVAKAAVPVVLMHMRGNPQTMQEGVCYRDLMGEILAFLSERIEWARAAGVAENRMIVDPGVGFGKSVERDNFTILRNLGELRCLGRPLLVGPSRKAFLGALLNLPVEEREEATAAAVAAAVLHGANIVRVHEVKKMKRVVEVAQAIRDAASQQG